MALTNIEAVRLKAGDQPVLRREAWDADGVTSDIKLELDPVVATPAPTVYIGGVPATEGVEYTVDYENGVILLTNAPVVGVSVAINYRATTYTDDEISSFLAEAGDSTTLATVYLLLSWSANAARLAKKESLAGGGGLGAVTLDLSVRAKELRDSARAWYAQWEKDEGASVPFEVLTEIAWTPHQAIELAERELLS